MSMFQWFASSRPRRRILALAKCGMLGKTYKKNGKRMCWSSHSDVPINLQYTKRTVHAAVNSIFFFFFFLNTAVANDHSLETIKADILVFCAVTCVVRFRQSRLIRHYISTCTFKHTGVNGVKGQVVNGGDEWRIST